MEKSKELKEKIEKNLPGSQAEVMPFKDDGRHFKAIVKSKSFEGKSIVEQHRMVLDVLKEDFKNGLHSISIEIKE